MTTGTSPLFADLSLFLEENNTRVLIGPPNFALFIAPILFAERPLKPGAYACTTFYHSDLFTVTIYR